MTQGGEAAKFITRTLKNMNSRKASTDKALLDSFMRLLPPAFLFGSAIGEGRTQRKHKRKKKPSKSFGKSKFLKG